MLEIRPIVVNDDMVVLWWNMRLKACKEAWLREVPIIQASELTPEQQNEFIIKDNASFGEWDFETLANEWNEEELINWGIDIPNWSKGIEANNMNDEDVSDLLQQEFDPIWEASGLHKIVFIFDNEWEAENFMNINHNWLKYKKFGWGSSKIWQVNFSTNYGK